MSHLSPGDTSLDGSLRILKSDLWNEGVDGSRGNLREFTSDLRPRFETYGVDISREVCRLAGKNRATDNIVCCDLKYLPFRPESMDIVVDISTIDHVEPKSVYGVITEYSSVLAKGGVLLIVFDPRTIMTKIRRALARVIAPDLAQLLYPPYHWLIDPHRLRAILKGYCSILSEHSILIISQVVPQMMLTDVASWPIWIRLPSLRFMYVVLQILRSLELSKWSKYLGMLGYQYAFLCGRT
jgi:SAM-dependent methyltransferase